MISADTAFVFAGIACLLALSPGPDNLFVLFQSMFWGWRAGFMITLGLCTGLLWHTFIVTIGIAALIAASQTAFLVLKLVGAAYLLYMAWQAWRAPPVFASGETAPSRRSDLQFYRRGILMSATNPKLSIFFLAFLPQFARPEAGSVTLQLLMLSAIFIVCALLVFNLVAAFSSFCRTLSEAIGTGPARAQQTGRRGICWSGGQTGHEQQIKAPGLPGAHLPCSAC